MKYLPRDAAEGKMRALAAGAALLRAELSLGVHREGSPGRVVLSAQWVPPLVSAVGVVRAGGSPSSADPSESTKATRAGQRIAGAAKQAAGAITDNQDLRAEGELQQEKADAAKEAKRADEFAAQKREEARPPPARRSCASSASALSGSRDAAAAREERAERDRQAEQQQAARDTAVRRQAPEQVAQAREQDLRRDEVDAVHERVAAEERAQDEEVRAEQARRDAAALENVEKES